jgi:hypothetical protein
MLGLLTAQGGDYRWVSCGGRGLPRSQRGPHLPTQRDRERGKF